MDVFLSSARATCSAQPSPTPFTTSDTPRRHVRHQLHALAKSISVSVELLSSARAMCSIPASPILLPSKCTHAAGITDGAHTPSLHAPHATSHIDACDSRVRLQQPCNLLCTLRTDVISVHLIPHRSGTPQHHTATHGTRMPVQIDPRDSAVLLQGPNKVLGASGVNRAVRSVAHPQSTPRQQLLKLIHVTVLFISSARAMCSTPASPILLSTNDTIHEEREREQNSVPAAVVLPARSL